MTELAEKNDERQPGISKSLSTSLHDAWVRGRLGEYDVQVQHLKAHVRTLETETVHLREKLEAGPSEAIALQTKLPKRVTSLRRRSSSRRPATRGSGNVRRSGRDSIAIASW
jgi:hypothetical protein